MCVMSICFVVFEVIWSENGISVEVCCTYALVSWMVCVGEGALFAAPPFIWSEAEEAEST